MLSHWKFCVLFEVKHFAEWHVYNFKTASRAINSLSSFQHERQSFDGLKKTDGIFRRSSEHWETGHKILVHCTLLSLNVIMFGAHCKLVKCVSQWVIWSLEKLRQSEISWKWKVFPIALLCFINLFYSCGMLYPGGVNMYKFVIH